MDVYYPKTPAEPLCPATLARPFFGRSRGPGTPERSLRPPFLAVFGLGTSPPAPLLPGEGGHAPCDAAGEAWWFALARGRCHRAAHLRTHFPHEWLVRFSYFRVNPEMAWAGTQEMRNPATQLSSAMMAGCRA